MKPSAILLLVVLLCLVGTVAVDRLYVPKFEKEFMELEKNRIVASNKLATAKIVHERLNHVRDLVFKNMEFEGNKADTILPETHFFDFVTACVNDLKLKLVSVRPRRPVTVGRVTTYSYDIDVEGDFFKFGELCAKFENSRRIVAIESFGVVLAESWETRSGGPGNKKIKVSMTVNTYRVRKS